MQDNPLPFALGRGAKLGLVWTLAFFVTAVVIYLIMGVTGWSGTLRALCALLAAPVLAMAGIAVWWVVRRPSLAPPTASSEQSTHTPAVDPNRTWISRATAPLKMSKWPEKDKRDDHPDASD